MSVAGIGASLRPSPLLSDEIHAYDAFVVPRYMTLFGEPVLETLIDSRDAQVLHVNCRTGYPDRALATRLESAHIYSCDPSPWALAAARAKVSERESLTVDYRAVESLPLPFPDGAFSHALTLHAPFASTDRMALVGELSRVLAPRGQLIVALPLRGSFIEVSDLFREYAVKHEKLDVLRGVELLVEERPTAETLAREVEKSGFEYVDVDVRTRALKFTSGRDFVQHPVARLHAMRELRGTQPEDEWSRMVEYLAHAIDKYWSGHSFELTVKVGCVTARRRVA